MIYKTFTLSIYKPYLHWAFTNHISIEHLQNSLQNCLQNYLGIYKTLILSFIWQYLITNFIKTNKIHYKTSLQVCYKMRGIVFFIFVPVIANLRDQANLLEFGKVVKGKDEVSQGMNGVASLLEFGNVKQNSL